MATPIDMKNLDGFLEHSVRQSIITQKTSGEISKIFLNYDLIKDYEIMSEYFEFSDNKFFKKGLDDFLLDYHQYQEELENKKQLEGKSFRIEELDEGWYNVKNGGQEPIMHKDGDVVEISSGEFEGEQLFSPSRAQRELFKVNKKLAPNPEYYQNMIKNKYNGNYEDFLKGENIKFSGIFNLEDNKLEGQGELFYILTNDGSCISGNKKTYRIGNPMNYLVSLRCIK